MKGVLRSTQLPPDRTSSHYAIGKELEDLGQWRAFRYLMAGDAAPPLLTTMSLRTSN
jgi:hypothetical protein